MDRMPFGERDMFGVVRRRTVAEAGDAGIVDEDVEAAVRSDDRGDPRLPRRLVADVERFERRADRGCGRVTDLGVDVGDEDVRALVDERFGNRGPDAACGSGDESDLACQPIAHGRYLNRSIACASTT